MKDIGNNTVSGAGRLFANELDINV